MNSLEINRSSDFRKVAQALSGELRIRILELLQKGEKSLNEIASALEIPLSTATVNVQKLDEAGLISIEFRPGVRGTRKVCSLAYERIVFQLGETPRLPYRVEQVSMPVGQFVHAEITPPCGICTAEKQLGNKDDPTAFFYPEKTEAQLIWLTTGWLEYRLPNILTESEKALSLEISAEICSEVPGHNNRAESDITLWVNGREISTWLSPGDFGGKRGKLTPRWWPLRLTQYGLPVTWRISGEGTFCNDERVGDLTPDDLDLSSNPFISLRIGVKEDAEHPGGMNLFGSRFGNHPRDILMKMEKTASAGA